MLQSDGRIDVKLIDHYVRKHLNQTVNRVMTVVDPLKVVIRNFPWSKDHVVEVPNNRNEPASGTRWLPLQSIMYIERSDFREDCPEGYNRLTPQQPVGLKYAQCTLELERVVKDPITGSPTELHVTCHPRGIHKPKAYIHWLSHPLPCTLRFYQQASETIAEDSLKEVSTALVEESVCSSPAGTRFQFERIGYFCVDSDSTPNKVVLNSTLGLHARSENIWPVVP